MYIQTREQTTRTALHPQFPLTLTRTVAEEASSECNGPTEIVIEPRVCSTSDRPMPCPKDPGDYASVLIDQVLEYCSG